jgi:hypothetical protein
MVDPAELRESKSATVGGLIHFKPKVACDMTEGRFSWRPLLGDTPSRRGSRPKRRPPAAAVQPL